MSIWLQGEAETANGDLSFTILVKKDTLDNDSDLQDGTTGVVQEAVNDAVRGAVHGAVQEVCSCLYQLPEKLLHITQHFL